MRRFKIFAFGLLITLSISCKDKIEFGETQTDFKVNSIYKANSDGLLYVKLICNGLAWTNNVVIISDKMPNPVDTVGRIDYLGSITLPIHKNSYWVVKAQGEIIKIDINWTPIE